MNLKFHIRRDSPWGGYAIYLGGYQPDGSFVEAEPITLTQKTKEAAESDVCAGDRRPMLAITDRGAEPALQSLIDELWQNGFRPRDIGTAGHLAATQAHLGDMRALVEKVLEVKLPAK